jgi:hypothetical protein
MRSGKGGLTPERFVALVDEFRQKITRERFVARLTEVKQDELIDLVKLHAEVRARYFMTVLDLVQPNLSDIEGKVEEARHYREMAEEIEKGVRAVAAAVMAKEIPVPGLDHGDEMSPELERALQEFIENTDSGWEY